MHLVRFCALAVAAALHAGPQRRPRGALQQRTAKSDALFERGQYYAERTRDDVVNNLKRLAFGDPLAQLLAKRETAALPRGSTVAVTGATAGIGYELAGELTSLGYNVVLLGRDVSKLKRAMAHCEKRSNYGAKASTAVLDLASLASAKQCAKDLADGTKMTGPIAGLVLNAGVWPTLLELTEDDLELTAQVNHIGHFALTLELLRLLEARGEREALKRVVVVASSAHAGVDELGLEDLNWSKRSFDPVSSYSASKLMNILFARELERRYQGFEVVSLHPSLVATELFRDFPRLATALLPPDPFGLVPQLPDELLERAADALESAGKVALASPLAQFVPLRKPREAGRDVAHALLTPLAATATYLSDGLVTPTSKAANDVAMAAELWLWTEGVVQAAADAEAERAEDFATAPTVAKASTAEVAAVVAAVAVVDAEEDLAKAVALLATDAASALDAAGAVAAAAVEEAAAVVAAAVEEAAATAAVALDKAAQPPSTNSTATDDSAPADGVEEAAEDPEV
ncbi:hypothetical protein M885DRAFT_552209 [Pelagophyceae sp. CCMP2097]|nr:hypothetical protein M885DRAFT_552209 [Pelagophyceae sp. CCMP2097]